MRKTRWPLLVTLIAAGLLPWGCAAADKAEGDAASLDSASPSVKQLWTDFCHYVVIASPDLAAAYGQRLLDDASPRQLRDLLAADDETTRRAVHLLDDTALTATHPDLGAVWARIRSSARGGSG
jgi:hypothetical protein